MSWLLTRLTGRLPIGWLQLSHNRGRLAAAVAGVAFANLLVFMQLGMLGALGGATTAPYTLLDADIMISSVDSNTLGDGGNVARVRMFEALGVPGVARAMPLFVGNVEFKLPDGSAATLQAFGLDIGQPGFAGPLVAGAVTALEAENTALIDTHARGVPRTAFDGLKAGARFSFEVSGQTLNAAGTLALGGGFSSDGMLILSDQTFLRLFPRRSSGAPDHILIKIDDGAAVPEIVDRLRTALSDGDVKVRPLDEAAAADLAYQMTERPVGVIFGFGVLIGIVVGLVIVYQVLSTDVADHLREYATFKAMGYDQRFFLGVVFEEAIVLAVFGFVPGVLVSLGLYALLSDVTLLPVAMTPVRAVAVFAGTLVACSLSGAIATRRLAAADPADLF
ncbi:FtsX-like permease family protein [Roseisalinus antarcticus]|uniref:FtsX-like permease family protein n=1 Tax=Roseisalinus antarcticus TaxID=254357 RepID=A0A1Y5RET2_9RHOB|nr:FtsX-like permease family protein [Roseisalinus antarcticus]SLN15782.1 FtsX-like permease family protein [Roseisalinus antarcticus]